MATRAAVSELVRSTRRAIFRHHLPYHCSGGSLGSNHLLIPYHSCRGFLWRANIGPSPWRRSFCSETIASSDAVKKQEKEAPSHERLSDEETRRLFRHTKVEDFKKSLLASASSSSSTSNPGCISLRDAIHLCKQTATALTDAEAEEEIRKLDEAGEILVFRRMVFLQPQSIAEMLSKAMPLPLRDESDPRKQELAKLEKEKAEIERMAEKQVRQMLWSALAALAAQSALFFRLTFWDLSWDVMEPIAFFVTSASLLLGFFFFVVTHRDPSYRDLMRTLLSNKQKKLMKQRNFDAERLQELQTMQYGLLHLDRRPHHHHRRRPRHGSEQ